MSAGEFEELRSTIRQLRQSGPGSTPGVQAIQDRIDEARSRASQEEMACIEQLQSRLDSIESSIPDPSSIEITDRERRTPVQDALDCADIPGNLNAQVESFVSDVRNRTGSGASIRERESQNLINEANNLRQQIENRASDDNPCKRQLIADINSAISDIGVSAPQTCTEKYPDLENRIDDLETRTVRLGPGTTEPELNQIRTDAQSLVDDMQSQISAGDENCFEDFRARIESAVSRLGRESQTVRVVQNIGEEGVQSQREEIENLQQNLRNLSGRAEEVISETGNGIRQGNQGQGNNN